MPKRVDLKTPYKWLRGSTPRPPWPDLTACVLSCELGCTIGVKELGWDGGSGILRVSADTGLASPWTAAGVLAAVDAVTDTGSMDRRVFFHLAGGALTEPALEWLIARPATDLDGFAGRRVPATHVDAIEEMTAQLRRMDDRFGGGTVLDLVRAQVRHVLDLLRNNAYSASIGIRLHACAAELLRLAGFLSFDAGRQGEAQRFWLAALRAAHAAGDRAIGANILGFLSCQAKDIDLLQEAIKLAEAARQGYPGGSPRVSAILHLRSLRPTRRPRRSVNAAPPSTGRTRRYVIPHRRPATRPGRTGSMRHRSTSRSGIATRGWRTGTAPAAICAWPCGCRKLPTPAKEP
jgi:hypothetical protein